MIASPKKRKIPSNGRVKWISLFRQILFYGFHCLLIVLYLMSILAHQINPKYFWIPALSKFFIPFLFVLIVLGAVITKIKTLKKIYIILIFLIGIPLLKLYPVGSKTNPLPKKLSILTYNVMGFGWMDDKKEVKNIIENATKTNPDVIFLQEYLSREDDKFKVRKLFKNAGYKYHRNIYVTDLYHGLYTFGLAIFSKKPLSRATKIDFGNSHSNGAFYVDYYLGKDTIRFINLHFESFGLKENEYSLDNDNKEFSIFSNKIFSTNYGKMRKAFRRKSYQVEQVKKTIDASPYPIILCGDFNDIPTSYTYHQLITPLKDAWMSKGKGIGSTFAGKIPGLRIDYILHSPVLQVDSISRLLLQGSDHYPLYVEVSFE